MNCERAINLVIDSLMDTVSEEDQAQLDRHLRSCIPCATEAEAMEDTWRALAELGGPPEAQPRSDPMSPPAARLGSPANVALRTAAAVALLLLGGMVGHRLGSRPAPMETGGGPSFLLLVRGEEPDANLPEETLVREYRAWARQLAEEGRLVGAERLTGDRGHWVSTTGRETRTDSDVSGYFVITASDYEHAVDIAAGSPHVRYGGTFEVRRIADGS